MNNASILSRVRMLISCLVVITIVNFNPGFVFSAPTPELPATSEVTKNIADGGIDTFTYNPAGRRDPFIPLVDQRQKTSRVPVVKPRGPLEKYELTQFRLLAVLVVKGRPMAMVKAPDGKSYPVKIGDEIGRYEGKVANIETKVTDRDPLGKRIEVSPDRIVVEETVRENYTNKLTVEYRYLTM